MIRTSTETAQLDEAFARAQGKFEAAAKDSENPVYKSKYADISSVIAATLEYLNAEGIGVRQHPSLEYKQVGDGWLAFMTVTTRLAYKGQWEESDISLPAIQRERFDAQSCGTGITYACRYALQGIFCVRREDDDANAASGIGSREAGKAVGERKIKEATERQDTKKNVSALFYTFPESHNGHFAEWINVSEFADGHKDIADMLRMIFTAYKAKKTTAGTALVPNGEMVGLIEKLTGLDLTVKELKAG